MAKFDKNLKELNEQLLKTAGKPLNELSEAEKADVVMRWALARGMKPKKSIAAVVIYALIVGIVGVFFAGLLSLAIKWLFTILGVI